VRSLRTPAPAPSRRDSRVRPAPAIAQLQRSLGNRSMRALLARDVKAAHPTPMKARRGEFAQITNAYAGGMDQKAWTQTLADAKAALGDGRQDDALKLYTTLYKDLAAAAGADKLRDVGPSLGVNLAKANDKGYAPGLNLVLASGGPKNGTTAFVDSSGKFGASLDPKAPPHIAIRLFSSSFVPDKEMSLGLLRHEMLHAHHHEQALDAVGKRKRLTGVDKILIDEATAGTGRANTELLAYLEGFMTSFHLIDPPPGPKHAVFTELLGALDTGTLWTWRNADPAVRDEGLGRLREYYCDTLSPKHQATFEAWVKEQEAQVAKDTEALRSQSDAGAVSAAKTNADRMFEHFVLGMKDVVAGSCKPAAKPRRAKATAQGR
jgi:hypothetical protein